MSLLTVPVCQKRWRYLRDYFVRQLHITENNNNLVTYDHHHHDHLEKKLPPVTASGKRSYWPFYERLSFLRPFSSTRRRLKRSSTEELHQTLNIYDDINSTQSFCSQGSDQTRASTCSPTISGNDVPTAVAVIEDNISNLDYLKFYQAMQMAVEQNLNSSAKKFENTFPVENFRGQTKRKVQPNDYAIDEHDCFFKSILSSVRRISDEHIIAFRTEVLQVLMKFRSLSEATDLEANDDGSSDDDVVIVNTEEAHWRKNLFRKQF